jgi:FlgD Ig-like domain
MTRTHRLLLPAALLIAITAAATPVNFFRNVLDTDFPSTAFPNVRFPVDVKAGDMDGDADLDLVATVAHIAGTGEGVYWYENNGAFAFTKTLIDTTLIDSDIDPVRIDVGDIDDDLDLDIVLVGANNLYLYKNSGSAMFARTTIDNTLGALRLAAIADLDGDLDQDIALLSNSGIYYLSNDGSENFTRLPIHVVPVVDVALAVVDLDGDSDIDIVSSTVQIGGDRHLAWYENFGGAAYGQHVFDVMQGTEGVSDVFVADVNDDGLLDITVAKTDDNSIWCYMDIGGNAYVPEIVSTFNQSPRRVSVSDLNNDTYEDIIAVGGNGPFGEVSYWENDGDQNFTYRNIEATAGSRQGLFVVDIDQDTVDDIFVASAFPAELVWFDNLGTGTAVGNTARGARVEVHANVPNPFNPSTTISFEVFPAGAVEVDVFAVDGAKVRTLLRASLGEGPHQIRWDGRDDGGRRVASGMYIARVRAHGVSRTLKMTLLM